MTQIDYSSGAMPVGLSSEPVGDTWRGIGSDWFNAGNVADEDWLRDEQSKNNEYLRSMQSMNEQAKINDSLAQRAYERDREGRQTMYQDVMQSMKAAGLNPILAYQNAGSSISAPSASASASGSSSGHNRAAGSSAMNSLLDLVSGLFGLAMQVVLKKSAPPAQTKHVYMHKVG
ncbi:DNA pilot protein [Sigmofec virus UA08Rod_5397]|uniref:DNA pilot protein n=1 Tax=Sigmofec virus UA08Rod_5397 TaxID=2929423 RepID=A0A976N0R6_9VIRU|nr:DNA pilot protein [Sigmofec virus UA08Rod_5397]